MHITSYGPIGAPGFPMKKEEYKELNQLEDPVIKELATKYNKTAA